MAMFSWCMEGRHSECISQFERHIIDPRTNKVVWLDETVHCMCRKRGCKCFVPIKDRPKTKKKARKK